MPRPLLIGRNAAKLEAISQRMRRLAVQHGSRSALADQSYTIYFDAQTTDRRADAVKPGHRRGQAHLLREACCRDDPKPRWIFIASPKQAGVKHGVVQDKLWLPGIMKLKTLRDLGFFGKHSFGARRVRLLGV